MLVLDGEGVGCVYATTEIEENESFATIPFKVCITEDIARKELPNLKEFSARTVSCLYLLLQKQLGEKSFYWPYINILPKEVKTPLLFDEDDFKYIANTNLESVTKERKAALLSEFERALEHLPESTRKEDFTWYDFGLYIKRIADITLYCCLGQILSGVIVFTLLAHFPINLLTLPQLNHLRLFSLLQTL